MAERECLQCGTAYSGRTVCPQCLVVLRPPVLRAASIVSFVLAAVSVALRDAESAVIYVLLGIFLPRMNVVAIGAALLLAFGGVMMALASLLLFGSRLDPGVRRAAAIGSDEHAALLAGDLVQLALSLGLLIALLAGGALGVFEALRAPRRELVRRSEREGKRPLPA